MNIKKTREFLLVEAKSFAEIGPQVARVDFEALIDSLESKVPAGANSTVCKAEVLPCVNDTDTARLKDAVNRLVSMAIE